MSYSPVIYPSDCNALQIPIGKFGAYRSRPVGLPGKFVEELKTLLWIETIQSPIMAKLKDLASSTDLAEILNHHLEHTSDQVDRLGYMLKSMGQTVVARYNLVFETLLREVMQQVDQCESCYMKDAAIISGLRRLEHFEISGYENAITMALVLEETESLTILRHSLKEEKMMDQSLSSISEDVFLMAASYSVLADSDSIVFRNYFPSSHH